MRAWLPYDSLEAAEARVGRHDGVEITLLNDRAGLVASAAEVAFVALPNYEAVRVWEELQDLDKPALQVVQLGSAGYEHMLGIVADSVSIANAAGVHDAGTAELAVALAQGKPVPSSMTLSTVNNGTKDVPSVLLKPVAVTKDTIKTTVVADGFRKTSDILNTPELKAAGVAIGLQ